jgi:DNA polymerase-1
MIEAFNINEDIHTATASRIYNLPITEITKEMRSKAKSANFGIIYGISAFGLAENLKISRKEAKELIDNYFNSYPRVKEYMNERIKSGRENGYVKTLLGRKRILKDINSRNDVVRGYDERNAINAPIQGTAADIIKIAMINTFNRINQNGLKSKMILQVHDELVFDVVKTEHNAMMEIIRYEMENVLNLLVQLKVEIGYGLNWLVAH